MAVLIIAEDEIGECLRAGIDRSGRQWYQVHTDRCGKRAVLIVNNTNARSSDIDDGQEEGLFDVTSDVHSAARCDRGLGVWEARAILIAEWRGLS